MFCGIKFGIFKSPYIDTVECIRVVGAKIQYEKDIKRQRQGRQRIGIKCK